MRLRSILALSATLGLASTSLVWAIDPPPGEDLDVVELLSGISSTPNKSSIDEVMSVADLVEFAESNNIERDAGLRIRALQALGEYAGTDDAALAGGALAGVVMDLTPAQEGSDVLILRAAMLSMARVSTEDSLPALVPLLQHSSRDIRAASAQALAISGAESAKQPLRDRALVEQSQQVKFAIADALFTLESAF